MTPRDRLNLRLPLTVAAVLLGSALALLATRHPTGAFIALLLGVAIMFGVLADLTDNGDL